MKIRFEREQTKEESKNRSILPIHCVNVYSEHFQLFADKSYGEIDISVDTAVNWASGAKYCDYIGNFIYIRAKCALVGDRRNHQPRDTLADQVKRWIGTGAPRSESITPRLNVL